MSLHTIAPYYAVIRDLLEPALRSLAIGLVAAATLIAFRVKSAQLRLAVWTGVLYAALAMPFLAFSLPGFSVPLPRAAAGLVAKVRAAFSKPAPKPQQKQSGPILAAQPVEIEYPVRFDSPIRASRRAAAAPAHRRESHILASSSAVSLISPSDETSTTAVPPSASATAPAQNGPAATPHRAIPWLAICAVLYGFIAAVLLARILVGAIYARRLIRRADAIAEPRALRILLRHARSAGLRSAPRLAESDLVSVPFTIGILRPAIVLPLCWRDWDDRTLTAVIAHEMSHIARRDPLTQRLSLVHRSIFWFSPLAWWLNRALVDAAEEASDEAALASGADRAFYAEILLGFFAALSENSGRVYWQGVSMAAPGQAERRLDRILNWKGAVGMRFKKSVALALAVAGLPVVLIAASAHPASRTVSDTQAPAASQAPQVVQASPLPTAPVLAVPALAAPDPLPALAALSSAPAQQASQAAQAAQNTPAPAAPDVVNPGNSPTPAAPVLAPPAPQAPGIIVVTPPRAVVVPRPGVVVVPRALNGQLKAQLRNEISSQVRTGIVNSVADAITLQTLSGINKQMVYSVHAMPQISDENAKKLKDLKQKLDELKKKDTKLNPDVQEVEAQIADLEASLDFDTARFNWVGPFPAQEKGFVFTARKSGDRFVIVSNNSPIIMSGDSQDVEHATGLRGKINGDFIWFQRDEKSYIIRDQNLVNQARGYFKPEQDLGDQQSALGKQQRDLGDQMKGLGDKMRDVKVPVPDMSVQMQKLMDQMKQLSASGGTPEQLGDLQRQLGDLQRQIGRAESDAMKPQQQTGDQMRELGDKMREIGSQQRDLGQKQRDASQQAQQQMKQLLDDAISKGTAQPE